MENRPFPIPTGEAFLVKTPYLDMVGQRLYKEHQQREQQQRADSKALDDDFSKNISGIRDADVPVVVQKYSDYKNLWKQLNKKGGAISPEQQMDLLRKKADVLGHIAKSKQEKATEETYAKDVLTDKTGKYNDQAALFLTERRKLPVDKMQIDVPNPKGGSFKLDMSDIDGNIKYQLGTTDFSKDFNNAIGQKAYMRIGESEPFDTPDGLQTQKKIYKGFSKTAPEVAASFLHSVVGSKKTSDLVKEHPELTDPNVLSQIDSDYDRLINSETYKNAYKGKVVDFPDWMHDTPQGRIAMYLAKQYAINNPPKEELDKPVNKVGAIADRNLEEWLRKNKITDQQHRERIRLNKQNGSGVYEIDNVPLKLKSAAITIPTINGAVKATDVTDWSDAELGDVLGTKTDKYGQRLHQPIEVQGKKYIKIVPNGFEVRDLDGNPVIIEDKEVIVNTNKRTQALEKPVGTGKAKVRNSKNPLDLDL